MTELASHLTAHAGIAPLAFAERVHFASPVADYRGRGRVARMFAVMPSVFDELTVGRELRAGRGETATFMHGRVGEHAVDLVLDERRDDDGLLREVSLFLRPLPAIEEAARRMRAALAPSADADR